MYGALPSWSALIHSSFYFFNPRLCAPNPSILLSAAGSPTLGGHMPTQVSVAMGTILRDPTSKAMPCGVFGSFGWSGEAVDEMEGRLRDAGFGFAFKSIRVKFKPTAKVGLGFTAVV